MALFVSGGVRPHLAHVSAVLFAIAFVLFAISVASSAHAEDPVAYYKGKTFRFVAGGGVGGGYDAYARMLAPHLGRALGATAIVENQPGAGGLAGLNRIYVSDPNGLQLIILNGGAAVLSQLFDLQSVQYDLTKLEYLATASSSPWLVIVNPDSPHNSLKDLLASKAMVRWSAVGLIDGLSDGASMMCEAFAMSCKVVMGYKSSSEAALAITRNEMDALYVSDTSANNYVKSGQNKAIATISRSRSQFFSDMPTVFETMTLTPEQTYWMELRSNIDALGRILVTTPGIPADRLNYLKATVKKVLTDPAVMDEGQKTQRYLAYEDGETTKKRALDIIANTPADQKAKIKDVVTKKYVPGGGE
jgi:tripartite-type tricarboxylate transporter receptor subunit TctC